MCWRKQAELLESPSGGVVMSAGAGALQVRLGGVSSYHGKTKNKPEFGCGSLPENKDINRSIDLVTQTLLLWCVVISIMFVMVLVSDSHLVSQTLSTAHPSFIGLSSL